MESPPSTSLTPSLDAVSTNQKVYYGLGGLGSGLISGVFGAAVVKFYSDVVGLSAGLISTVFLIYAIWNAINDPIFGYLSDRIKWKGNNSKLVATSF